MGPKIYLDVIKNIQKQDPKVQSIVEKTIRTGAYFCHSEMILQHLLSEGCAEERQFAVTTILQIREAKGHPEIGDGSFRKRKNPIINMKASSFMDLIDWSKKQLLHEPVLTTSIPSKDLADFLTQQMVVENFPVHTQVFIPFSSHSKNAVRCNK